MRYSAGASPDRVVRRIVLSLGVFVGAVTVAAGVVGLLAPISVSSQQNVVGCGSAVAPDLPPPERRTSAVEPGSPLSMRRHRKEVIRGCA